MSTIRINKYLASLGVASRRKVDELVLNNHIRINQNYAKAGNKINPEIDKIYLNNILVSAAKQDLIYLVLNKPAGYVTTTAEHKNQKTVLDLINIPERIFPVGRLDKDTTGLLLLTNDGDLTYKLTHPKFEKEKTYLVTHTNATTKQLRQLATGVLLDGVATRPAIIKRLDNSNFEVTIHEGRNRQIRKMCDQVGINLTHLHRTSFHGVTLENLAQGKWRYLTKNEIIPLRH